MKRLLSYLLLLVALSAPVSAQFGACLPGFCGTTVTPPICTDGGQTAAFLARTSGLDATHVAAYSHLICGLVEDGTWDSFDFIQVYATQDSATALLNLVSTSYTAVAHGSPTFTADRGFTGVESSNTVYIDTGFNPTVGTPKYTQDDAHLAGWNLTNGTTNAGMIGSAAGGLGSNHNYVIPKFTDNNTYWRLNVDATIGQALAIGDARGQFIITRVDNDNDPGYINGLGIYAGGPFSPSVSPVNLNFYSLGINLAGAAAGSGNQIAMVSAGSKFDGTTALLVYNRFRAYMTAVGVP